MLRTAGATAARLRRVPTRLRRVPTRLRQVPAWLLDGLLAGLAFAALLAERIHAMPSSPSVIRLLFTAGLAAIIAGSLAVRRPAPLAAYLLGSVALVAEAVWLSPSPLSPYVNLIGLYSVGFYASRERTWWGPIILLSGLVVYFVAVPASAAVPAGVVFVWLLGWALGYGAARRRERNDEARRRMRREAVDQERTRIARELHDLVGHTVNLMLVQAGAARVVLERDPGGARGILVELERAGREALDELDLVLGVLRQGDEGDSRPGLEQLPRLAERMGEAGMAVEVRLEPATGRLARSVDMSAYRIAQEALTNALRHGRASEARVCVRCDDRRVELEVSDNGRGPEPGYLPRRGLTGIAERAALFGGTAEHGGGEGGGFRVRAVLPLP